MEGGREGGREGGMEGVGCSLDRDHSCIASQTVCRTLPLLCVSMCMCVWSNTQCIAVCTYTRALSPCSSPTLCQKLCVKSLQSWCGILLILQHVTEDGEEAT